VRLQNGGILGHKTVSLIVFYIGNSQNINYYNYKLILIYIISICIFSSPCNGWRDYTNGIIIVVLFLFLSVFPSSARAYFIINFFSE
jgi:hypothetical protein